MNEWRCIYVLVGWMAPPLCFCPMVGRSVRMLPQRSEPTAAHSPPSNAETNGGSVAFFVHPGTFPTGNYIGG
jgi:hypothetical protein